MVMQQVSKQKRCANWSFLGCVERERERVSVGFWPNKPMDMSLFMKVILYRGLCGGNIWRGREIDGGTMQEMCIMKRAGKGARGGVNGAKAFSDGLKCLHAGNVTGERGQEGIKNFNGITTFAWLQGTSCGAEETLCCSLWPPLCTPVRW